LDKENPKGKDNRNINGIQLEPIEAQSIKHYQINDIGLALG